MKHLINKFFWFTKPGTCYLFFSFAVCDYFTHEECKEFSVSDCKKCASYSPYVQKVLSYHSRLYPFGMLQHHIGGVLFGHVLNSDMTLSWEVPMAKTNELICCWSDMIKYLPYPFLTYQVSDLVSHDIIAADKCEKQRAFMCLRLSLFTSQVAHQACAYPCFSRTKTLGVFLLIDMTLVRDVLWLTAVQLWSLIFINSFMELNLTQQYEKFYSSQFWILKVMWW